MGNLLLLLFELCCMCDMEASSINSKFIFKVVSIGVMFIIKNLNWYDMFNYVKKVEQGRFF